MVVLAIANDAERASHVSLLKRSGFTVVVTSEMSEVNDLVVRFLPEIAVLDLEHGGRELARRLRSDPLTSSIGIVGLGAQPDDAGMADLQVGDCDVLLEAPCAPETLLTDLLVMLADLVPDADAADPAAMRDSIARTR